MGEMQNNRFKPDPAQSDQAELSLDGLKVSGSTPEKASASASTDFSQLSSVSSLSNFRTAERSTAKHSRVEKSNSYVYSDLESPVSPQIQRQQQIQQQRPSQSTETRVATKQYQLTQKVTKKAATKSAAKVGTLKYYAETIKSKGVTILDHIVTYIARIIAAIVGFLFRRRGGAPIPQQRRNQVPLEPQFMGRWKKRKTRREIEKEQEVTSVARS